MDTIDNNVESNNVESDESYVTTLKPINDMFWIQFNDMDVNTEVGRLYVEDGQLKFKGNVDASAKIFFDSVIALYNNSIIQ